MNAVAPVVQRKTLQHHRFPAMGVAVELLVETAEEISTELELAELEVRRLDSIFSRFDAASELSRLNRAGTMRCSHELVQVLMRALAAREATAGRFDPTVHDALIAAGYDRTFRDLPEDVGGRSKEQRPCGGVIDIDERRRIVSLREGARIDLGGIVKGYAAERVCDVLAPLGPCLVNAAGDIALREVPAGGAWTVGVPTPHGPVVLALDRGGLATSGRDYRRWRRNGIEAHHLIDPFTGAPSASDLLTVTVAASDAIAAEIQAKSLFLAGESAALREAEHAGLPCLLVTADSRVVPGGGLA